MRKLILLTLLFSTFFGGLTAQNISPEQIDQIKRNARKNNHITVNYRGKIIKSIFSHASSGGFLKGVIFQNSNGDLIELTIPYNRGIELYPMIGSNKQVDVTVRGDEKLLEDYGFKGTDIKDLEKELHKKITGQGHLKLIVQDSDTLVIEDEKRNSYFPRLFLTQAYETLINIEVSDRVKVSNKQSILLLKNGDSLFVNKQIADNKEKIDLEKVSYVRPIKDHIDGYFYKSTNSFQMAYGLIFQISGYDVIRLPSAGLVSMFLENQKGEFISLFPDESGLISYVQTESSNKKIDYRFDYQGASKIQNFIEANGQKNLTFFYRNLSDDGLKRSEKFNYLYAICSVNDTLRMEEFRVPRGTIQNYENQTEEFRASISQIYYRGDKNTLSGLVLDNKAYIKLNGLISNSIAKLVENGKEIKIEGWKRKELDTEINQLGYSIYIPSKITIDGKTFVSKVNLASAL